MTTQPPPPQTPAAALDAREYAFLAHYGDAVRRAPGDRHRELARQAAVAAARRYHDEGVSWAEIAKALGIRPGVLRDWRGGTGTSKHPVHPGALPITPGAAGLRPDGRLTRMVLVAMGSTRANGNDFPSEAAAIRHCLAPHRIQVAERCAIELGELQQELEELRPAVLHMAAHVEAGLIHLSAGERRSATSVHDVCAVIRRAHIPPALVVFNGCDTAPACEALTRRDLPQGHPTAAALGWRGTLTDPQAQFFTERFYAGLAAGGQIGRSLESPGITVTARWPGRAQPALHGDASAIPFPRDPP